MSPVLASHSVWLMRRAAVLEGTSADARAETLDPVRGAMLYRIATRVTAAADAGDNLSLSPAERTVLVTEAQSLTDRAAQELKRPGGRDLRHAEECVMTARIFREILEATREEERS